MRLGKKKLYEASILNSKKTSIGFKPEVTRPRILGSSCLNFEDILKSECSQHDRSEVVQRVLEYLLNDCI